MNKKLQMIISAIISIIVAIFLVAITIHLLATFELMMLPKLIVPIIIVFLPIWSFVHYGMFKKK